MKTALLQIQVFWDVALSVSTGQVVPDVSKDHVGFMYHRVKQCKVIYNPSKRQKLPDNTRRLESSNVNGKGKGKAHPRTGYGGPDGE